MNIHTDLEFVVLFTNAMTMLSNDMKYKTWQKFSLEIGVVSFIYEYNDQYSNELESNCNTASAAYYIFLLTMVTFCF